MGGKKKVFFEFECVFCVVFTDKHLLKLFTIEKFVHPFSH